MPQKQSGTEREERPESGKRPTMYPPRAEDVEFFRPNAAVDSEIYMYKALSKLPHRDHVFFSIPWIRDSTKRGVQGQSEGECDFLVFDPRHGFMAIEVKGGSDIVPPQEKTGKWTILYKNKKGEKETLERNWSPYEQAVSCMRYIEEAYEERHQGARFPGVFAYAVAFPFYDPPKNDQHFQEEITITRSDIAEGRLGDRIAQIFALFRKGKGNVLITEEEQRDFLEMLQSKQNGHASMSAKLEVMRRWFDTIDFAQDCVLDLLQGYNRVQIVGGAGTGKTYIAMKKVLRDLDRFMGEKTESGQDRRILLLSRNRDLADRTREILREMVRGELEMLAGQGRTRGEAYRRAEQRLECLERQCRVRTFEDLMREHLGEKDFRAEASKKLEKQAWLERVEPKEAEKYDSIVVDEAQDFTMDMGFTVNQFLRSETESGLYVFFDRDQGPCQDWDERKTEFFSIESKPYILQYNIRNTESIFRYAKDKSELGVDTRANERYGIPPKDVPENGSFGAKGEFLRMLKEQVNELIKEGVKTRSIVLLSNVPCEESWLAGEEYVGRCRLVWDKRLQEIDEDGDMPELCFRTVEQFKGLEADVVIYLQHNNEEDLEDRWAARSMGYVAYTRARFSLFVFHINDWKD